MAAEAVLALRECRMNKSIITLNVAAEDDYYYDDDDGLTER